MLDPFSSLAIAIATAIAQFIDFGAKVLKTANDIQRDKGTTKDIADLEHNLSHFKILCEGLQESAKIQASLDLDGHNLPAVAARCKDVASEIQTVLETFRGDGSSSKVESLKLAFRAQRKAGELKKCEQVLMATKMDFCTNVLKALHNEHSSVVTLLRKVEERDRNMETALAMSLSHIQHDVERLQLQSQVQDVSKVQLLLDSFRFDAMRAREGRVIERHAQSFQWIFSSESVFARWLSSFSGLFWINGKAGSGKSTMMKFLFECPETHSRLDTWAGDRKLVISRHFFWNAGTPIQKSFQGLLQAICYDIFRTCPGLLPLLCKERWASISGKTCLLPKDHVTDTWSESEMATMIRQIGESDLISDGRATCLFILIDGLDEYYGQHDELSNAIIALSQLQNIKICVSSRPWNVFKQYFSELSMDHRCLVLQDLTKDDIAEYVRNRLEENRVFLKMLQRDDRCSQLAIEITEKADGVFLWVFLVINELLKSLGNHDDYETLLRGLRKIPPGLEPYFKYMFDNLDQFYKSETARIFRAAIVSTYEFPVLALSVIFSTEPMAVRLLNDEWRGFRTSDIYKFEDILERRMVGCCGDLLERMSARVTFLHRTVRDFLATDEMTTELNSRTGEEFDIDVTMCRISIFGMKCDLELVQGPIEPDCLIQFFTHARKLEDRNKQSPVHLHDAFQKAVASAPHQGLSDPHRLLVLAAMNVTLELDRSLNARRLINSVSVLEDCAQQALRYLLQSSTDDLFLDDDISKENTSENNAERRWRDYDKDDPPLAAFLVTQAIQVDHDRREFQPKIVTLLLKYGAPPSKLWSWALPNMYSERERCSEYRRSLFLTVSSELLQAGAAEIDIFEGASCTESKALEEIFGSCDAQWLLSQRKGSNLPSEYHAPLVAAGSK